jgi:hypothetical protein
LEYNTNGKGKHHGTLNIQWLRLGDVPVPVPDDYCAPKEPVPASEDYCAPEEPEQAEYPARSHHSKASLLVVTL